MTDWTALRESVEYDRWANLRWLECLQRKPIDSTSFDVLAHILAAQAMWLARIEGDSPNRMPEVAPTQANVDALFARWAACLVGPKDFLVSYRNTRGESFAQPVTRIVRHVVNHGTYHRGEIRGLFLARGDENYPETDLILYLNTKS